MVRVGFMETDDSLNNIAIRADSRNFLKCCVQNFMYIAGEKRLGDGCTDKTGAINPVPIMRYAGAASP